MVFTARQSNRTDRSALTDAVRKNPDDVTIVPREGHVDMRITPLGDAALRLEFGETIEASTVERVQCATRALVRAALPGISDVVPAYAAVTVYYDAAALRGAGAPADDLIGWLVPRVQACVENDGPCTAAAAPRTVEIPVCYGGEYGPDLESVAQQAGLSTADVVRRHAAAEYLVAFIGFTPGFPYLMGLDPVLVTRRLVSPRLRVPAGSVGIAGEQTGIYPSATPGGWNIIGRTPLRLFLPHSDPPTRLEAGDRLRVRVIGPDEFRALEHEDRRTRESR